MAILAFGDDPFLSNIVEGAVGFRVVERIRSGGTATGTALALRKPRSCDRGECDGRVF
jgi:hypothetical protein